MNLLSQRHSFAFQSATTDMGVFEASYDEPRVEISLIIEGAITFVVDGKERVIKGPAATFQAYRRSLDAYIPRDLRTRTMWCHLPSSNVAEADWEWLTDLPTEQTIPAIVPSLFAHGVALGRTPTGQGGLLCPVQDALGALIFAEYIRCAQTPAMQSQVPPAVLIAKRMLEEEYETPWTIDRIAHACGVNGNYLIHLFTKHVGEPPIRYLWRKRVDAGVHLLRTTRLQIDEISYRCGFQTAAHFSRLVKQYHGRPPSQLR